ncbi:MAG: hypothetical protein GC192_12095 [Bacteroidetes bacterium]|nr:hypothetical protein [Bacteroidota bacterium]
MEISSIVNWRLLALKGVFILIAGMLAFFFPVGAMETLAIYLAILMGLGGIAMLVFSSRNLGGTLRGLLILEGIFDIAMALLIVFFPLKSAEIITIMLGVWFIVNGLFQLLNFNYNRKAGLPWKKQFVNGLITFLLGLMISFNPFAGIYSLALIFGIAATFFGVLLISIAFDLRKQAFKSK